MSNIDALKSFRFLTDNLPSWISSLVELSVRASTTCPEYCQLTQSAGVTPKKPTNCSTESLRPIDGPEKQQTGVTVTETSNPPRVILGDPSNKHLFREARRKRKPGSVISGASGPQKYRTRSMIIVYYDSFVQEAFEALVRNIGSARNNLRKGKMQASMKERMSSLGDDEISFTITNFGHSIRPKTMQTKLSRVRTGPEVRMSQATAVFDTVEKELEAAQSLCEVAAHQFLRDGDCGLEIEGTRQRFEVCLTIARKEVDRLEEEEKIEKEQVEAEERAQEEEDKTARMGNGYETIEIDDGDVSDSSSFHLDITAFRSTRR
ncbi:MAG: hypothetical protein M1830_006244 [Pleopsidium flavum]|nr:MAG: hypothetical protein M1830_006244 [Pleopsidium flavum]